jgi:CBS domain-containing protein
MGGGTNREEKMSVGDIIGKLNQQLTTCRPTDTVQTVATLLTAKRIGALPVCDESGRMVGIVSERDIVTAFAQRGGEVGGLSVRDIMTRDVVSCKRDDTLDHAREVLHNHRFRHLPVVEGGQVIAMLSIRDLLESCLMVTEMEKNVLKDTVIAARFR